MSTPPQPIMPVLDQKQVAELQTSIPELCEEALELEVSTPENYTLSGSYLDSIVDRKKKVTEFFQAPAQQASNVHRFITSLRATLLQPLENAENLLKNRRREFRQEAERQRLQEEQRQREEAKAAQDAEALRQATDLAAIGETEAANFVIDRAATSPPPPVMVPSVVPKQAGHTVRPVFKFRIVDEKAIKREFLSPDESKIGAIVRNLGRDAVAIVGGIEVIEDEVESVRRGGAKA